MTEFAQDDQGDFYPTGNGTAAPADVLFDDDETGASFSNYEALFDVPDFATLIRGTRSSTAREYETRVKSAFKTVAINALRHNNLADAAAVFEYGPAFSAAAGDLSDKSEKTRQMIDILTSPENPYVALVMIALPFAAQLFRNHQPVIQQVTATRKQMRKLRKLQRQDPEGFAKAYPNFPPPETREPKNVEVKLPFGRKLSFRVALKINPIRVLGFAYHTQTHDPDELVNRVFSDPKLIAALKKQRINIVQTPL